MELRRQFDEIYYHSDKNKCDFVIMTGRAISRSIQACWSMENKITAQREIKGLLEAMHAHKLPRGIILTHDDHADFEREGKKIMVRPLWHFALR